MSHRFAMICSIAITLLLAGGVYASRDRLMVSGGNAGSPESTTEQTQSNLISATNTPEFAPPERTSLEKPTSTPDPTLTSFSSDDDDYDNEADERDGGDDDELSAAARSALSAQVSGDQEDEHGDD